MAKQKPVYGLTKKDRDIVKDVVAQVKKTLRAPPQYRRGGATGGGDSARLAADVISDNPRYLEVVWFKVTEVGDPLTCIEQSLVDGAWSDKEGATSKNVLLFPQIDTTHYAVGNKIAAEWLGTDWQSLYNQPAAFCEDT